MGGARVSPIDYRKYPKGWKTYIRPRILERADNKCEWCGAENYKPHPITGSKVILTVAHLDQDIRNNTWANLVALCQRCHLNHDKDQHAATADPPCGMCCVLDSRSGSCCRVKKSPAVVFGRGFSLVLACFQVKRERPAQPVKR